MEQALTDARSLERFVTRQPMPAVAFGGRRIAWIYTKTVLLIEYWNADSMSDSMSNSPSDPKAMSTIRQTCVRKLTA